MCAFESSSWKVRVPNRSRLVLTIHDNHVIDVVELVRMQRCNSSKLSKKARSVRSKPRKPTKVNQSNQITRSGNRVVESDSAFLTLLNMIALAQILVFKHGISRLVDESFTVLTVPVRDRNTP